MLVEIIVPQRGLEEAKGRLAPQLTATERFLVARELLLRTIAVASAVAPVSVVSPSAALGKVIGATGAGFLVQPDLGLNRGLEYARDDAIRRGVGRLAVVHADLPLLSSNDVGALLSSIGDGVAIAPDKTQSGTNAVAFDATTDFGFCFGPKSFDRHRTQALLRGVSLSVVRRRGLSFDLDTPHDLAALRVSGQSRWMQSIFADGAGAADLASRV